MNTNCLAGMRCPKCGQEDQINVAAKIWTSVIDNGTDDDLQDDHNVEYDEDSEAACPDPECGFTGTWGDFQIKEPIEVWTAVVLSESGEYHGTCVARTEEEVWDAVTEQFDPENEWAGTPKDWGSFAEFFQFNIHPNPHELEVQ